jgi:putative iron-regulated protein
MYFDRRILLLIRILLVCLLPACSPTSPEETESATALNSDTIVEPDSLLKLELDSALYVQQILDSYLNQINGDFSEVVSSLDSLLTSINELLQTPTESTLILARESWSNANTVFEQTAVARYFSQQIATEEDSLRLLQLQYQMNQWPILAGYIDSVEGYTDSGIVHDINVELTADTVRQQHGLFGDTEATLGFHVIEFLLWGEPSTSSRRIASDFEQIAILTTEQQENGLEITQLSNNRRREMLSLTTGLLLEDFKASLRLWRQAMDRVESIADDLGSETILSLLLRSTSSMITEELLVKSLYPILNNDFEISLQAPYSQTTQSAVAAQMRSVESLILETPANDGTTLDKILVSLSPDFEEFFYQNLDAGKACLILLYNRIGSNDFSGPSAAIEFETVECINLLTNLVDQLDQIELLLPSYNISI